MQEAHKSVVASHPTQRVHHELLMVGCWVCIFVDRRHLELPRSDLIVTCRHRNTQLVEFELHLIHELEDPRGDRAEVMVVHLLTLRRLRAKQRPASRHQIRSTIEELLVYKEVLLLRAARRTHGLRR